MDPFFVVIAILFVTAGALLLPIANSFRKAPVEKGLIPLAQERCSVQVGRSGIYAGSNVPLARVALYPEFLVISFFSITVIPYKSVAEVSLSQNLGVLGSTGVRLRLRGIKSNYLLFPRNPKAIANLIESRLT